MFNSDFLTTERKQTLYFTFRKFASSNETGPIEVAGHKFKNDASLLEEVKNSEKSKLRALD